MFRLLTILLLSVCLATPLRALEKRSTLLPALPSALAERSLLLDVTEAGERLVAVGAYGHVLLSDDYGESWRQARSVPTQATLTAVSFIDEQVGWAVGHDAVIIKTTDRGETWTMKYVDLDRGVPLLTVLFLTDDDGLAMGALGLVLETDNGGVTWTERPIRRGDLSDFNLNRLVRGGRDLYVASELGLVYRSRNSGRSFEPVQSPAKGDFWDALVLRDGSVVFCGSHGELWRARRDLTQWDRLPLRTGTGLAALASTLDGRVVVVGLDGVIAFADGAGGNLALATAGPGPDYTALAPGPRGLMVALSERGITLIPDSIRRFPARPARTAAELAPSGSRPPVAVR